jgi:hypothetical protein
LGRAPEPPRPSRRAATPAALQALGALHWYWRHIVVGRHGAQLGGARFARRGWAEGALRLRHGILCRPGLPQEERPGWWLLAGPGPRPGRGGRHGSAGHPGASSYYVGNWTVLTPGTSSSAPLTIEPAPGVAHPTLDGSHGKSVGCGTKVCNGPVLTIGPLVHVDVHAVTFKYAHNTANGYGGGIQNNRGGTVAVSGCEFLGNTATYGGAIDNGDHSGQGTLKVSASVFSGNLAGDGGAIDNGDNAGRGNLTVSGSRFSGNTANGAEDNQGNVIGNCDGGTIDNGDESGHGTFAVSGSTFSGDSANSFQSEEGNFIGTGDGGAIANAESGHGTVVVSRSTFSNDSTNIGGNGGGGAIDNDSAGGGHGTVTVSASTFSGDSAPNGGPFKMSNVAAVAPSLSRAQRSYGTAPSPSAPASIMGTTARCLCRVPHSRKTALVPEAPSPSAVATSRYRAQASQTTAPPRRAPSTMKMATSPCRGPRSLRTGPWTAAPSTMATTPVGAP